MEHKYIVALEVGSSKIRAALGEVDDAGTLTVKAVEEERLVDSVRHGVVLNVSEVAEGARKVLGTHDPQRLRRYRRPLDDVVALRG